ncbi:hypothetical protein [Pseudactinotalea suaedae]|uniref:hypothetical protein n=1 Tax=Pseudactinotalea suaedae TaxID=1524924 RepID=UPI0012E27918|nr:hypothetical protein [Pseudactinotalea suaedae]
MTDGATDERWVKPTEATSEWAAAAAEVLTETASNYLGVITYADLAEQVQALTGLRTRAPYRSWIGSVLAAVVAQCRADGLPPLTSLVVYRADSDIAVEEGTALARFACYRRFAADVPAAAVAEADALARSKQETAAESRERAPRRPRAARAPREQKPKPAEEAPKICPTCFMQLPASGICDNCD